MASCRSPINTQSVAICDTIFQFQPVEKDHYIMINIKIEKINQESFFLSFFYFLRLHIRRRTRETEF